MSCLYVCGQTLELSVIIIPLAACMHSLVSTLSAPQIFIAYSMKNLRCGNAGYEASVCMLPKVL